MEEAYARFEARVNPETTQDTFELWVFATTGLKVIVKYEEYGKFGFPFVADAAMATPFTEHIGDGDAAPKFNLNSPSTEKEIISEYVVELVYVKVTLVLVPATGEAS